MGGEPDALKGFENRRVEILGTFDGPAGAAANSASGAAGSMRGLRITSIRPVAGDCSPRQN